jgi:hypothetical protein
MKIKQDKFSCPFCFIKLDTYHYYRGTIYFCRICKNGIHNEYFSHKESNYRFNVLNGEIITGYEIYINDLSLRGETENLIGKNIFTRLYNVKELKTIIEIDKFIELNIHDPIKSANKIIKQIKLLSAFQ